MKRFLAIYVGTEAALEKAQWNDWTRKSARSGRIRGSRPGWNGDCPFGRLVDQGPPLGKTKRASPQGITDIKNSMTAT